MKSSIIKAVTQTQFETYVSAFIALDFKLRWEKLSGWDLRQFHCSKAFFMTTVKHRSKILLKNHLNLPFEIFSVLSMKLIKVFKQV